MMFEQKTWLEPFIDLITQLGDKAENKFQERVCEGVKKILSGKFVEDLGKKGQ